MSSDDYEETTAHPLATTAGGGEVKEADGEIEEAPPVVYSSDFNDSNYDLEFPTLKILQRTSPEVEEQEGRAGDFYLDGVGVIESPVTVIPLARTQFRIRREDPRDIDSEIVCRSSDAFTGYGDPGGNCSTCPFAQGNQGRSPRLHPYHFPSQLSSR